MKPSLWRKPFSRILGISCALFFVPHLVAAEPGVESASEQLSAATASRESAEVRLADLKDSYAELEVELNSLNQDSVDIARQLAESKEALRNSAVAAYVSGSGLDDLTLMFSASSAEEVIDRVNFSLDKASSSEADVLRYQELRKLNTPEIVALSDRIELLEREIAEAEIALIQANAVEADAERALGAAQSTAAEQQRAADEAAARESASAQASTASQSSITPATEPQAPAPSTAPVEPTPPAQPAVNLPEAPAGGPTEAQWAQLRQCESSGNYQIVSASGRYRGAYQFSVATWQTVGGTGDPAAASPAEQDLRAKILYSRSGWRAWPHCGKYLW